jgi:hypothetical protein
MHKNNKILIVSVLIVSVLFSACGRLFLISDSNHTDYDARGFWANNSGTSYFTEATKMAEGKYCQVWIEDTQRAYVSMGKCTTLANEYDAYIHHILHENFGSMKVDFPRNNGKVILFLLEIRTPNVAGYFSPKDFGQYPDSNHAAVLYLGVSSLGANVCTPSFYAVVAHEGQHLIN